jgi:hypothetical protein
LIALRLKKASQEKRAWFFRGAEEYSLKGTIVGRTGNIIVLEVGETLINVVMHGRWFVEEETIISLPELFEGEYVSMDEAELDVLSKTVTNEKGVSVTYYYCYEINGYNAVMEGNINL